MNSERAVELITYLNMLILLEDRGLNLKIKIEQVLSELHNAMGFLNVEPVFAENDIVKHWSNSINGSSTVGTFMEDPFNIFG